MKWVFGNLCDLVPDLGYYHSNSQRAYEMGLQAFSGKSWGEGKLHHRLSGSQKQEYLTLRHN
jgi:hypothetical protein